jgi:hypothetical protein
LRPAIIWVGVMSRPLGIHDKFDLEIEDEELFEAEILRSLLNSR